ncbi:hypothetical protein [Bradyrhizobium sp. BR 1432]|uniref:hypothetical protein n=1 Tax=Bradyrhizobium sp. BR 1432 TaxID=3447966 RepID=UPI003EE4A7AE
MLQYWLASDILEVRQGQTFRAGEGAAVEGLAATVLVPALTSFKDKYPGIFVEVVTALQTANLTRREADISIGIVRPTGLRHIARRIARCDIYLEPKSLEEADDHVFVDYIGDMIETSALKWLHDTVGERRVVSAAPAHLSNWKPSGEASASECFSLIWRTSEPTFQARTGG